MDIKDNKIMLLKEDLECIHLYLDDLNIPRTNKDNEKYSIVGRIKELEKKHLLFSSKLESHYLVEPHWMDNE